MRGPFWIVSEERRKRKRLIQIVTIETSFTVCLLKALWKRKKCLEEVFNFFLSSSEKCHNESFDAKSVARVSNALRGASTGFNLFFLPKEKIYNNLSETRKCAAKSAQFEGKEWSLSALCARYGVHCFFDFTEFRK